MKHSSRHKETARRMVAKHGKVEAVRITQDIVNTGPHNTSVYWTNVLNEIRGDK